MNNEKAIANNHALTEYAKTALPQFVPTLKVVNDYFVNPDENNLLEIRKNAPAIRELWRSCDDIVKALSDLKAKMEFAIANTIECSPEIRQEFKIQKGSKSIKCDSTPESMAQLMERFVESGFNPSFLFSMCTPITAKKAAEAFGLSEQAMLETHGDLFATHENKPSVKML